MSFKPFQDFATRILSFTSVIVLQVHVVFFPNQNCITVKSTGTQLYIGFEMSFVFETINKTSLKN